MDSARERCRWRALVVAALCVGASTATARTAHAVKMIRSAREAATKEHAVKSGLRTSGQPTPSRDQPAGKSGSPPGDKPAIK